MIYPDPRVNPFIVVFTCLAVVIAVMILLHQYPEQDSCKMYNEMRAIHENSDGEFGWPEYEEGKDEECGYGSRT